MNRRSVRREARLVSGLILFAYITSHLANHALGSISMATAERGLHQAVRVWQSAPGTVLLYGAASTHVALAFWAVYERRTLRMPPVELLRLVLGFAMPTLLIGHAVATRAASTIYGHPPDYAHVVWMLQHSGRQGLQMALLVPGWLHGCLGLRFAFGRRAWFVRLRPILSGAALLLPVLAVLGFVAMTKEVAVLAADPTWAPRADAAGTGPERLALDQLRDRLLLAYGAAIVAMLVARHVRAVAAARRGSLISIAYPRRVVRVPLGWSLLEASRAHGIAHRSACGGQGRCSTCRVRITAGATHCPPPRDRERRTLVRIDATPDVRLACQVRPAGDLTVVPLVDARGAAHRDRRREPRERDVIALCVAMCWDRSFNLLLPHDRLHAIHRFHDVIESTVDRRRFTISECEAGHVMLWTAIDRVDDPGRAMRSALAVADALDALAAELSLTIGCRSAPVIALHRDIAVVDDVDFGETAHALAVGDVFDAVRSATRHDEHCIDEPCSGTPTSLLATTTLLGAAAPGRCTTSTPLRIVVGDGRPVAFVRIARDRSPQRVGDPGTPAATAIDAGGVADAAGCVRRRVSARAPRLLRSARPGD